MIASWEIRYCICTSGLWRPSSTYPLPWCQRVCTLVSSFCWIPKMCGWLFESRCYHVYKLRYSFLHTYLRFVAAIFDLPINLTSESTHISPTVLLDFNNGVTRWKFSDITFKLRHPIYIWFRPRPLGQRRIRNKLGQRRVDIKMKGPNSWRQPSAHLVYFSIVYCV